MCGRFAQCSTRRAIHALYGVPGPAASPAAPSAAAPPDREARRFNGAPGQDFAACRSGRDGLREIVRLRWGLPPFSGDAGGGARPRINARAETVHERPSFAESFRLRRCLVPADGWFEWRRLGAVRQPWFLAPADGSLLSFAALWSPDPDAGPASGGGLFAIITAPAAPELADVHHRQPAIIGPSGIAAWLDPRTPAGPLRDLLREPAAGPWEKRPVGSRVNRVENDDPDILTPVPIQPVLF